MSYFFVCRNIEQVPPDAKVLQVGENLITGENDFNSLFSSPTSLESDLLLLASTIFSVDRATPRGEREDICRNFRVSIPVVNIGRLQPLTQNIEDVLYRLTNDGWNIEFRQAQGEITYPVQTSIPSRGGTLLFSGGLDSLAGAIEFGRQFQNLNLVSHHTHNQATQNTQKRLAAILREAGYTFNHFQYFVSSRSGGPTNIIHDEENSQRTRSFMFLILGALSAIRCNNQEIIYIAENGQLAIHLSLSVGRISAFSTHTAHPDVLKSMESFLSQALESELHIINPFIHMTKREVVKIVYDSFPSAIPLANSCWRNSRLSGSATHCGECVPCFIRRIAIESFGQDNTEYARDPWIEDINSLPPDDTARRNLLDLLTFIKYFWTESNENIMSEWPELYSDALVNDAPEIIDMYRRFSYEGRNVLGRYPNLVPFLL